MSAIRFLILFFPCIAFGQSITQTAPVWYGPRWVTVTGTIQLVAGSSMTPVGSTVPIPDLVDPTTLIPNTSFDFTFPSISTAYLASGVQLTINQSGGGLIFKPQTIIYPMTLSVPAGYSVKVHYDSPLTGGTVTANAVAPPPPMASADCSRLPNVILPKGTTLSITDFSGTLIDSSGATWTVGAHTVGSDATPRQVSVKRNGVQQFGSVDSIYIKSGQACVSDFDSGPGVSCYVGTTTSLGLPTGWIKGPTVAACP